MSLFFQTGAFAKDYLVLNRGINENQGFLLLELFNASVLFSTHTTFLF